MTASGVPAKSYAAIGRCPNAALKLLSVALGVALYFWVLSYCVHKLAFAQCWGIKGKDTCKRSRVTIFCLGQRSMMGTVKTRLSEPFLQIAVSIRKVVVSKSSF